MERRQKSHDAQSIIDEWAALYALLPPMLKEGEKHTAMIAAELGVDHKTAGKMIRRWVKEGKIVPVGKRRIGRGADVEAWKVV